MTSAFLTHPDSTAAPAAIPSARIATYLFIVADIMFFMGFISGYLVLRSAQPELFARSAEWFNRFSACLNTLIMSLSAITMAMAAKAAKSKSQSTARYLAIALGLGCAFLTVECVDWIQEYHHHSIVAIDQLTGQSYVYDGYEISSDIQSINLEGHRKELIPGIPFDIHLVMPTDVIAAASLSAYLLVIDRQSIFQDLRYTPSKNIFYACYYTLTAAHALHLLAAMLVVMTMLLKTIGGRDLTTQIQNIALYWYVVAAIWLFLFPMVYLI